jgi:predicted SAM-dependent methyltransferase
MVNKKTKMISELKIDLACGQNKTPGFHGIDIAPVEGVDSVVDLEQFPWPIESDSAEEIICSHYVEHTNDLMKFMNEIYRILKPGGKATFAAPYYTSMRCWQDPTHKRAISESTFLYYNKDWRTTNKLTHYPINPEVDFDFSYGYVFTPEWVNKSIEVKQFGVAHYNNVVSDIHVQLTKK